MCGVGARPIPVQHGYPQDVVMVSKGQVSATICAPDHGPARYVAQLLQRYLAQFKRWCHQGQSGGLNIDYLAALGPVFNSECN